MTRPTTRSSWLTCACMGICVAAAGAPWAAAAEPAKTRTVEAGELKLKVPEAWQQKPASSTMRLAQFTIPKVEGDAENGEFVVFFFGGAAGGAQANVERWIKQFQAKDRKVTLREGKSPQGEYVFVDLRGTWNKPVGPMIQQKTVPMPHARVLGVILAVKGQGNYFIRLTGPEKTITANADAFRTAIGANEKSEKEYKLGE